MAAGFVLIPAGPQEARGLLQAINLGGWFALAAGGLLLIAPLALNFVLALAFVALGATLLLQRTRGDVGGAAAGLALILVGTLIMAAPMILNYLVITLLLVFHVLVVVWMFHWGYQTWGWIYLALGAAWILLLLLFPTVLNYLLAFYLLIIGAYLLAWRWRLRGAAG